MVCTHMYSNLFQYDIGNDLYYVLWLAKKGLALILSTILIEFHRKYAYLSLWLQQHNDIIKKWLYDK